MPTIESHVRICVKAFGKENEALCYQLNGWMDAASRLLGPRHRVTRHDLHCTTLTAWVEFLNEDEWKAFIKEAKVSTLSKGFSHYRTKDWATSKVSIIANMIMQHLELDGLLTPRQLEEMKHEGLNIDVPKILREIKGEGRRWEDLEAIVNYPKEIWKWLRKVAKEPNLSAQE